MPRWVAFAAASVLSVSGCVAQVQADPEVKPLAPAGQAEGVATISYDKPQQMVEGFGFSTAWGSMPGEHTDAFLSVTDGAGLSIVRNRIPFRERPGLDDEFMQKRDGAYTYKTVTDEQGTYKVFDLNWNNWDLAKTRDFLKAAKENPEYRVTKVFSTPWTPPNNAVDRWKLPSPPEHKGKHKLTEESYATTPDSGGYLDPAHYQDYADVLADYVLGFEANMGVPLYALSIQNEPNYNVDYESCDWTAEQLRDFLLVLNKQFTRKGVWKACPDLKIMAAEDNNFHDKLLSAVYADEEARKMVHIAAGHQYEYGPWSMGNDLKNLFGERDRYTPNTFDASRKWGKSVWMSEWSLSAFAGTSEINRALILARVMHQDFTGSGLNGFVFWWSGSLLDKQGPTKCLWSLAQYSRFVRPGWRVLQTEQAQVKGVYVTAFADTQTGKMAVVAVNTAAEPKTITLRCTGGEVRTLSLYRTSEKEDMSPIGSMKVDGAADVTLEGASIGTYYIDMVQ